MLTISLPWAVFLSCGLVLAGIGLDHLINGIIAARTTVQVLDELGALEAEPHVCPEPSPVEVHVQGSAADPEPQQRHPGNPEPVADAEPLLFHAVVSTMFGAPAIGFDPWPIRELPEIDNIDYRAKPHWDSWHGTETGAYPIVGDGPGDDECDERPEHTARQRFTKHKPSKHLTGARA